jgi:tRNA modification GTPase
VAVSARTGAGLEALRARLVEETTARAGLAAEAGLTRPRHRAALAEAEEWLDELDSAVLPELRAEALRAALRAVGRVTGRVGVEAVLDLVFGEFCIGK